jgi:hypothetical protein
VAKIVPSSGSNLLEVFVNELSDRAAVLALTPLVIRKVARFSIWEFLPSNARYFGMIMASASRRRMWELQSLGKRAWFALQSCATTAAARTLRASAAWPLW